MATPRADSTAARRWGRSLGSALAAVAAACAGPKDSTTGPPPPPSPVASLVITGPDTLIVSQSALLMVTARDAGGQVVTPARAVWLSSSDPAVAVVEGGSVIRGTGRGTATITGRADTVTARWTVAVKARVAVFPTVGPSPTPIPRTGDLRLAVGDSMHYVAAFVDINGQVVGSAQGATWASNDPAVVSVNDSGWVTAHAANSAVVVTAFTPDGSAERTVLVSDVVAGLPATVRLVHAVQGVGPITFRSNRVPPVTLSFGQSVTLAVTSGSFQVDADGLPPAPYGSPGQYQLIAPGATLSLYATTGRIGGFLTPFWNSVDPISADSGLVRLVQGSSAFPVVYVLPTGAALPTRPDLCYLDPGDPALRYVATSGTFDLVLREKPTLYFDSLAPYTRLAVPLSGGRAVTLVLLDHGGASADYLVFPDP